MPIVTLVPRNARQWLFPALCVLGLFLVLSYGCGGGGGGGGSIVLPPYATTGTITGSVTSSGDIIANLADMQAGIRAAGVPQAEIWLEDNPSLRTTSGVNGAFSLEGVPFGSSRRVVAKFFNQLTQKTYKIRSNPLTVSETATVVSAGQLGVEEATNRVQGYLKDTAGNPIRDAQLTLWGEPFKTDLEGRFITPPLPPGVNTADIVVVQAIGVQPRTINVPFQSDVTPDVDLVLTPTGASRVAPFVALTAGQTLISPNQQVQINAEVTDPDETNRENLKVDWEATAGSIASSTNKFVKLWTAPSASTIATITVTVTDSTELRTVTRLGLKVGSGAQPNQKPVASNVRVSGSSGNLQVLYNLADANNDPLSIKVSYSLDGGQNFTQTTSLTGSTTQILPGSDRSITWRSALDVVGAYSQVVIRITPSDSAGTGTSADSAAFAINNAADNQPPVVTNVSTTGTSGDIAISFSLADANNDACSVVVAYSVDGGNTYVPTTNITGATTGVLPGVASLTWNSAADISDNQSNVRIRVTPSDATVTGTSGISAAFAVNNGSLSVPVVSAVSTSGSSGNITVTYTLAEANSTPCTISVLYSVDNGTNYTATTNVTGTLTGVAPGSGKTLTWNSSVDVPGNQSAVKIRVIANNGSASSAPGESPAFAVSNNTLPVVSNVVTSGNNGNISITYQLADANNDACSIVFAYSIDDGVTFNNSGNITGTVTGVAPGSGKTLIWNSAADISGNQNNVKVRLTPADAVGTGTAGISSAFVVTNNNLPVVSAVTTSGSAGDITITYSLADPNNDPCNLSVFYSTDNGATFNATANITGTLTGVTPGIGKTLTWDSKMDVPGNQSQVKIRIVANDGSGSGSPGDSAAFVISNNTLPEISNVVASGTTGNFVLTFELVDANNDPCNVTVAYSTDGGSTFKQTTNLTGKTAGIAPGVASLTWNSAADINGNEGNVKIRITPSDAVGSGTAGLSPAFAVSNNNLPVVSAVTTSGASGNVTITYTLADPNNDACNITVYYSTDGGSNYIATTNLTGTLTGVTPGSGKNLVWNSAADVNGNSDAVRIKISASDGNGDGTPGESATFAISNNTPPVVSSVSATGNVGNIVVTFNLADANSHLCSIGVFYSIDGGANYTATTNITGKTSGINPGVASITWNSAADINGNQNNVKIRIVPNDGIAEGTAGNSAAFAVTNNNLPTVANVTTTGSSGNITITYNLSDPNNDPCNITVYYSTDNGANYTQTTSISGTLTNVTPGSGKTLTWNSVADVNTNSSNVKIKIAASDNVGNGTPAESPVFAVNNNQLPVVSAVTTSGNSGDITISYSLADGNNDTCNIAVFYSTNDGSTYTQTTNFTGSATSVLPGAGKTLVWKSVQDVNRNVATVKIRLIPTDKVGTGTGAESPTFAVNNNQLPVVTNVATSGNSGNIAITFDLADGNNDSCKVALAYSTDGGTTYIPTANVIGNTTGITPGTGRSLSWNSTADVTSSQANVRVRVQPADSVGSGTAGISPAFAISNNQPPAVTNVVPSGTVGDITVTYTLADTNNDPCSIVFYYSIDGGINYFQTGNVTGSMTGILPGASRSIVWNSSTDIPGSQSNVRVKIQPNDGTVNGTEGQSAVFSVNNNNLPVASSVTTSGNSGNITVTYNLADANGDNCAINVFYSRDNGATYTQTTNISGTTTNIPPGTGKTITWDSTQDVTGNVTQVKVRIVPRDSTGTGAAADSAAFAVNNNSAPVVSSVVASGTYGDITITYTLADNESDPCSISLAYSTNGGTSYTATTNITGTVTGVAPGTRTLVWKSSTDFSTDQASVRVRVTANDGNASSVPADSATFAVTNSNQPPTISSVTTTGTTGAIAINYTLADPNSDPCSIAVFYSTNGGTNYAQTNNITGKTTEVAPGTRSILWNSPPDINGSIGNVRVKVVPTDRGGPGTGAESGIISVDNIGRPVISNVTASGGRGNISITYDYSDPNSDPGALQVWYSLDNGVNFIKSNSLTGQLTAITPGAGRTITWNSAAEVNGSYSQVKIRILMSDGTGIGTPGTSTAFTLSNDGLPTVLRIVNSGTSGQIALTYDLQDPNNDLCSIEVFYSVDGGLNYTKTTNLMSGLQTQIVPGTGKTITWNSNLDILGYYPNARIKIIASDPLGAGIPAESPLFMLRNNRLPAISSVSTSGNSGDISVTYTLADADSDACSITPEYSTDNGINWFPTFSIAGSLSNVTPGAGKTFTWRSADDFLSTYSQVRLRLTPNDGVANGTPGMTTAFAVANNSLPSIASVTTSGTSGAVTITFNLADGENNPCSVALHYSVNGGVSYSQSTFISGQTSNVLPGTGNVIVWESSNNVTTNVADVRVRLVPNDGTGNGTAGISSSFALNNDTNSAPAITALSRTGTSGNITFAYTLADANGDACSVKLYYSTDSGTTYYQSSSISGATAGVLPGSGRNLIWNSVADVNSTVNGVLVKLVPQDARAEGTSMTSAAFNVTNNTLPVVSSVTVTGDSGPIPISYTLADSNTDPCNITVSYSTNGGLTFNPATNVSGTLTGVAPGSNRSLTWNSASDISGNQSGVRIRLSASDAFGAGTSGETVSFTVNNNKLPVVSSVTASGTSGNITITYNLNDENGHTSSIQVFYSTDGGVTYLPTDDLTGTTTNIATGTGKTIVWNSAVAINRNQTGVRVRVVPSDQYGAGTGANSSAFNVVNNQAPVASLVTTSGTTGNIVVTYTLADGNSDQCSVLFYYSTNGGTSYNISTSVTGQTSALNPGSDKVLTWNSNADINTDNTNVRVRVVPNDGTVNGTAGNSATFSILNNRTPIVSNVRNSGSTGDIVITYDLADQNNDLVSLGLSYTVDNGTTYTPIAPANLTGQTTGITPGANKTITWNSAASINGDRPSVRVRIIPSDAVGAGSSIETSSFAVANNNLPTVSNIVTSGVSGNIGIAYDLADANLNNCAMGVFYSIDNGISYTQVAAGNLSGDVSGVAPGNGKLITWNSTANIPGSSNQVKVKVLPNDGTGNGTPGESTTFTVTNNSKPSISGVSTVIAGNDVTVSYTLADNEGDTCSIALYYSVDGGSTYTVTNSLTGFTSVAPGARNIVWNSLTDFRSNSGNIRVKVEPNDGQGSGTVGISNTFALSNNALPQASNVIPGAVAGAIPIAYDLSDSEQNPCSIEVYYSTNNGITYTRTTNLIGATTNLAPTTNRSITWNSGDDFVGKSDTVRIRIVPNDGFGNGSVGISSAVTVNNNSVPVISSLITSGSSGDILLSFNLADANNHACDLSVDYSLNGGTSWASATGIVGALAGVSPGTGRTLTWNSRQTFTNNQANVRLRITPRDPFESGAPVTTAVFPVNNNRLPAVSNVAVSGNAGDISVSYTLADEDNHPCNLKVAYSLNGGAFTVTNNVATSSAAVPPGTGITIVWNSALDVAVNSSNVRLKLTPNDGTADGSAGDSAVFSLNNNQLPVISNTVVAMSGSIATFTFDISDGTGDLSTIALQYSTDNGSTWKAATNFTGDKNDVATGVGKKITWNTFSDLPGKYPSVRARLIPNDGSGNGTIGEPAPLVINNNRLPAISSVVVTGTTKTVSVSYSLADLDNDNCNIAVAYSIDGAAYVPTTNIGGAVTGVSPASGIVLTWDTVLDNISYSTNVRLRLTANDGTGNGTPVESAVFTVNNVNVAPIVTAPTWVKAGKVATFTFTLTDVNNDLCNISAEYSVDNGTTYQPANNVTGDLTGVPPATGRRITWRTYPDITGSLGAVVKFRITPHDGKEPGIPQFNTTSLSIDNTPPAVSNIRVTKNGAVYDILYNLAYPSVETGCTIAIWYSTDGGITWLQTTDQAPTTGVMPGNNLALTWDPSVDLGVAYNSVILEIRPSEGAITGTTTQSEAFPVNNVDVPALSALTLTTSDPRGGANYTGDQRIAFSIDDVSSTGSLTVAIDYTANNGLSWSPITADRQLSGLAPGANEVYWESYRDYAGTSPANQARIRLTVTDGELTSAVSYLPAAASFTLSNLHMPSISAKFTMVDACGGASTNGGFVGAAMTDNGQLWVWGYSYDASYGAYYYGIAGSNGQNVPTQAVHTNIPIVTDIACTYQGLMALRSNGTVYCVGRQTYGELGNNVGSALGVPGYDWSGSIRPLGLDTLVASISASSYHSMALLKDGTVRCWGYNGYGQLGDGTTTQRNAPVTAFNLSGIKKVSAGGYNVYGFSLALKNDGTVWSWGYNAQGQLGLADTTNRPFPVQVILPGPAKDIAAGGTHAVFLLENGEVWSSGSTSGTVYGNTPVKVNSALLVDIQKVFAGGTAAATGNTFAVDSKGWVFGWGDNAHGQLGLNNVTTPQASPVRIPGLSRITSIALNDNPNYKFAIFGGNAPSGNSGLWTAGYGYYWQLGNNAVTNYSYFYHP